jgi:hypothetical protein
MPTKSLLAKNKTNKIHIEISETFKYNICLVMVVEFIILGPNIAGFIGWNCTRRADCHCGSRNVCKEFMKGSQPSYTHLAGIFLILGSSFHLVLDFSYILLT